MLNIKKEEWQELSLDDKLNVLFEAITLLQGNQNNPSNLAAPSKPKREKWDPSDSFEVFMEKSWKLAEKGINSKLKKKGFDNRTQVTFKEAFEKAKSDKTFMENYNLWIKGDKFKRPTMFFEGHKWGLNHLEFGTNGEFMKRFKKGAK